MEPVGTTGISSVMQQSSTEVAKDPLENVGQMSSSSQVMTAPPIMDVPSLEEEEEKVAATPSVPAIESTEEVSGAPGLKTIALIGSSVIAALIIVLMFIFRGKRRRHRRS
jgi:hypothetical protein